MVVLFTSFIFHDLYFLKLVSKLSFTLILSDAFSSLDWFIETGVDYFKGEVTSLILTEDYALGMTLKAGEMAQWLSTFLLFRRTRNQFPVSRLDGSQLPASPVLGPSVPSLGLCRHLHTLSDAHK